MKWLQSILPHDFRDLSDISKKISTSVIAYAAGDAFGVPYEFSPRRSRNSMSTVESRDGWPFGGVSDDTFLTIMTLNTLNFRKPSEAASQFLKALLERAPKLRGLGPTTRSALGLPISENERKLVGNTNGGMMRTALTGMAFLPMERDERRAWVKESVMVTHKSKNAVDAAILLSAFFSDAVQEGCRTPKLEDFERILSEEFEEIAKNSTAYRQIIGLSEWLSPAQGISLDPFETMFAVLWTVLNAENISDVFALASSLGGDTDTVCALSASLYVAWSGDVETFYAMDWLRKVSWDEISDIGSAIESILKRRSQS